MELLVSVIIPVYNVENLLQRCVDSVIKQTYRNLEIILVNDGSTDQSGVMCDDLKTRDSRIVVYHKPNGGLSDARNHGIERANGELIIFLDSDDWMDLSTIEKLYKLMKISDADISICNHIATSNENEKPNQLNYEVYEYSNLEALLELYGKQSVQMAVSWGKLFKKQLFETVRFPLNKIHEDEFVIHHLLYQAHRVVYTSEPLMFYWQRPDSITGVGFNFKKKMHAIEALNERLTFFNSIGEQALVNKTYRSLFIQYLSIKQQKNKEYSEVIQDDFKHLRKVMRERKFDLIFTIYYKLYNVFPNLMLAIFKLKES